MCRLKWSSAITSPCSASHQVVDGDDVLHCGSSLEGARPPKPGEGGPARPLGRHRMLEPSSRVGGPPASERCHRSSPAGATNVTNSTRRRTAARRVGRRATCYHGPMERAVDKAIVLVCCLAGLVMVPWEPALIVALLVAVVSAAVGREVLPRSAGAFCRLWPSRPCRARAGRPSRCSCRLPCTTWRATTISGPARVLDGARARRRRAPAARCRRRRAAGLPRWPSCCRFALPFPGGAGCLPSPARQACRRRHLALEEKNRGLARQAGPRGETVRRWRERGRIAREIHDNVGHLLTRSIMQVEALQVVHRDDERVRSELAQVGATLHEAMSTVRASVHDLHDDAFDLETQLREAADAFTTLAVDIDYRASDVPPDVGYGLSGHRARGAFERLQALRRQPRVRVGGCLPGVLPAGRARQRLRAAARLRARPTGGRLGARHPGPLAASGWPPCPTVPARWAACSAWTTTRALRCFVTVPKEDLP